VIAFGTSAAAHEGPSAPPPARLVLTKLHVSPQLVQPGDVVTVDATIANVGLLPASDIRVATAITGNRSTLDWTPLDPPLDVPFLKGGKSTTYRARLRINHSGGYMVGVLLPSADGPVPTLSHMQPVRAVAASVVLPRAGLILLSYFVIALAFLCSLRLLLPRPAVGAYLAVHESMLRSGILVAVLGVALLSLGAGLGRGSSRTVAIDLAAAIALAGWLTIGASVRTEGKAWWRGMAAAGLAYIAVGLAVQVGMAATFGSSLPDAVLSTRAATGALVWPTTLLG
jgi:hypothetical protein